jgi:glycosyltransferase involved in cell wall biosynthesis
VKLLWISNHPDRPSGYGSQTRQVGRRLLDMGVEVEFSANDGSANGTWRGAPVHGSTADRYSRDIVREDLERIKPDWTVILYDAWVYTHGMQDPFRDIPNVAGWVPVDHNPIPPTILPWVAQHTAIAMAEYGRDQLEMASERLAASRAIPRRFPVLYAPHAIDDVFRPTELVPSLDMPFRSVLGLPDDAYLVGIVAANTGTAIYDRKGFSDMTLALAAIQRKHPEVWVYVHSLLQGYDGIDLAKLFEYAGLDLKRLIVADEYAMKRHLYSDADMAGIYSSFDVLLSTSRGEGCGLAPWEAMACGVPVIVSNWTAQAEVVGPAYSADRRQTERFEAGWRILADPDWDPRHGAFFGKPVPEDIAAALDDLIDRRGDPALREAAIARAATRSADRVFDEHWRPILAHMDEAVNPPTRQQRRAKRRRAA